MKAQLSDPNGLYVEYEGKDKDQGWPEDFGVDSCMRVSMETTKRGEGNHVLLRARYVQVPHRQPGRDNQLALRAL